MNGESYRLKRSRENAASQAPEKPEDAQHTVNAAPSCSCNVATLTDLLQTVIRPVVHGYSATTVACFSDALDNFRLIPLGPRSTNGIYLNLQ